jgi:hypothetical protein
LGLAIYFFERNTIMAQTKGVGFFRAEAFYNSLDEIDGFIAEAAGYPPQAQGERGGYEEGGTA